MEAGALEIIYNTNICRYIHYSVESSKPRSRRSTGKVTPSRDRSEVADFLRIFSSFRCGRELIVEREQCARGYDLVFFFLVGSSPVVVSNVFSEADAVQGILHEKITPARYRAKVRNNHVT